MLFRSLVDPSLVSECESLVVPSGGDPVLEFLAALLEVLKRNPAARSAGAVMELMQDGPHAAMLGELGSEIVVMGDSYDCRTELVAAVDKIRRAAAESEATGILSNARSLRDLTPEEMERLRYGGREVPARPVAAAPVGVESR